MPASEKGIENACLLMIQCRFRARKRSIPMPLSNSRKSRHLILEYANVHNALNILFTEPPGRHGKSSSPPPKAIRALFRLLLVLINRWLHWNIFELPFHES